MKGRVVKQEERGTVLKLVSFINKERTISNSFYTIANPLNAVDRGMHFRTYSTKRKQHLNLICYMLLESQRALFI